MQVDGIRIKEDLVQDLEVLPLVDWSCQSEHISTE